MRKDKMGDDIVEMDNLSSKEDENLAPLEGMCYESLCEHYRVHCTNVEI